MLLVSFSLASRTLAKVWIARLEARLVCNHPDGPKMRLNRERLIGWALAIYWRNCLSGTSLFFAAVSTPGISSRGHFVASHFVARTLRRLTFVAGTLGRQPFRRGDTSSPAVSSRGHFVKGRRGWRTKTSICNYKCIKIILVSINLVIINECIYKYKCIKIVNISLIINECIHVYK